MTPEQRAAFIFSQTACMLAQIEGMKAENAMRERQGQALAWGEDAFIGLVDQYGLSHNQVVTFLRGETSARITAL